MYIIQDKINSKLAVKMNHFSYAMLQVRCFDCFLSLITSILTAHIALNNSQTNSSIIIDYCQGAMMCSKRFANAWKGPDWNQLKVTGAVKDVDLNQPDTVFRFFAKNADNYISRHDISLFKQWSVTVVHTALENIDNITLRYKFVIHLLRPHPNDGNKRFIVGKTFKKLSKDTDGFKWCRYIPCDNFNFHQKDALKSFIGWLEKNPVKSTQSSPVNIQHRQIERRMNSTHNDDDSKWDSFDNKMMKMTQILSTMTAEEYHRALYLISAKAPSFTSHHSRQGMTQNNANDVAIMPNSSAMGSIPCHRLSIPPPTGNVIMMNPNHSMIPYPMNYNHNPTEPYYDVANAGNNMDHQMSQNDHNNYNVSSPHPLENNIQHQLMEESQDFRFDNDTEYHDNGSEDIALHQLSWNTNELMMDYQGSDEI